MGYACPVCETPQRDGEHLANHLAFTAMLHGDDHEAWLDEHVDDWGGRTPGDLARAVVPHAEETDYDEVFEDTTDGRHDHGSGHDHDHGLEEGRPDVRGARGPGTGGLGGMAQGVADEAVESVIEDARELTEEMYAGDGSEEDGREHDEREHDGGDDDGVANADGGDRGEESRSEDEESGGDAEERERSADDGHDAAE